MVFSQHVNKLAASQNPPILAGGQLFYDVLKKKIAEDFCRHVDPIHLNTLLKYRRILLTEEEQDNLKAVEMYCGRWKACKFLLDCLANKKKWFKYLIKALRDPDSNLDFLADRFVHAQWSLLQQGVTNGAVSPETPNLIGGQPFYDVLKQKIAKDFCRHVDPIYLNTMLKYRRVLLTEQEQDKLKAVESSSGRWKACEFLLDCLANKKKWFKYLIMALMDPGSGLAFLAEKFEYERGKLMETYYSDEATSSNISYIPQASSLNPELPIGCDSGCDPPSIDNSKTSDKVVYTRL